MLVGLGLSLVSDTSDRPGQQEVMLFRHFLVIFDRRTPKILPAGQDFGPADMGGGGGGGGPIKFWLGRGGGGEKRRFSLEKRSERPWPLWGRGEFSQEFVCTTSFTNQVTFKHSVINFGTLSYFLMISYLIYFSKSTQFLSGFNLEFNTDIIQSLFICTFELS